MTSRYNNIAECMIDRQYTKWNVVEIHFDREGEAIDVAIATVCTMDGRPPKERNNSRITTTVFRENDYGVARRYARSVISELNVKAIV